MSFSEVPDFYYSHSRNKVFLKSFLRSSLHVPKLSMCHVLNLTNYAYISLEFFAKLHIYHTVIHGFTARMPKGYHFHSKYLVAIEDKVQNNDSVVWKNAEKCLFALKKMVVQQRTFCSKHFFSIVKFKAKHSHRYLCKKEYLEGFTELFSQNNPPPSQRIAGH